MMQIYTEESLAKMLGCEVRMVADARRRGELAYFSIGKKNGIRFTQQHVEEWIASRTKKEVSVSMTDIQRRAIQYCTQHPLPRL